MLAIPSAQESRPWVAACLMMLMTSPVAFAAGQPEQAAGDQAAVEQSDRAAAEQSDQAAVEQKSPEQPAEGASAPTAEADEAIEEGTQDRAAEKRETLIAEATAAVRETQNALKALDEDKAQTALAALERATGKLELIIAREPALALAPSGVGVTMFEVIADVDTVEDLREKAEDLLDDGRVQEARHLIRGLASEAVISVSNIPLATYPDAIKEAARLIHDDNAEEAKRVLQTALNTLVVTDTIIPLPIVAAEKLLEEAETLAEKENRTAEENTRLADLLEQARTELEFADALGYGAKKDFEELYEQLSDVEEKTEGGQSGAGLFAKIKSSLGELLDEVAS